MTPSNTASHTAPIQDPFLPLAEVPATVLSVPFSSGEISTEVAYENAPCEYPRFPINPLDCGFSLSDSLALGVFGDDAEFPGIDAAVENDARELLDAWDPQVLRVVANAVAAWAGYAPIRRAEVSVFADAEVEGWRELLLEIWVDASTADSLRLWSELAATIDNYSRCLTGSQSEFLRRQFAIHLLWD